MLILHVHTECDKQNFRTTEMVPEWYFEGTDIASFNGRGHQGWGWNRELEDLLYKVNINSQCIAGLTECLEKTTRNGLQTLGR